jgi:hypothetical protein
VCLTFDCGDPSQLDVALPALNSRGIKATFFLIGNQTNRKDDWRKILLSGHEIGNDSLDSVHVADLKSSRDMDAQVTGAQNVLQKEFGITLYSYAYPFGEASPQMETLVAQNHLLARGGAVSESSNLKIGQDPDWMNLPSRSMGPGLPWPVYQGWIDQDLKDQTWLILRIQSLDSSTVGGHAFTSNLFTQTLDYLQTKNIWIDTFLKVGSYFRAQKIFEKAVMEKSSNRYKYRWNVPNVFPPDVSLRFKIEIPAGVGGVYAPAQGGKTLKADREGFYTVEFNRGEMDLLTLPKN